MTEPSRPAQRRQRLGGMLIARPLDRRRSSFWSTTGPKNEPLRNNDLGEAIAELDEVELEKRLYPSARESGAPPRTVRRPLPDWSKVREDLARRDHQVTSDARSIPRADRRPQTTNS
jgi:hypothetical protein